MDYVSKIDTETTYSEEGPKKTIIRMTRGLLKGGFLYYPSGAAGLLHCVVTRGPRQLLPANRGSSYALDDCVVPLDISTYLYQPPYDIEVLTWNDSTSYSHSLTIGLFLDPFQKELPVRKAGTLLSRLFGVGR